MTTESLWDGIEEFLVREATEKSMQKGMQKGMGSAIKRLFQKTHDKSKVADLLDLKLEEVEHYLAVSEKEEIH